MPKKTMTQLVGGGFPECSIIRYALMYGRSAFGTGVR